MKAKISTTQEYMPAILGTEASVAYIDQILNAIPEPIYTVDKEFRFVTWNAAFDRDMKMAGHILSKGHPAFQWDEDFRKYALVIFHRAFQGEKFEFNSDSTIEGKSHQFVSLVTPIYNETGEILEVAVHVREITERVKMERDLDHLLKLSQKQTEQLKLQEEELEDLVLRKWN